MIVGPDAWSAGNAAGKYADATEKVLGMHYFN
jgi:hypothetical protein